MDEKIRLESKWWQPFAWITAASALAHGWCLRSVFFMDDGIAILRNEFVVNGHFWETRLLAWTNLFYSIQYKLFGMSPLGFHAVNWLLHTSVACALYVFGREFLKDRSKANIALFAAVLFAVHPLGSEIPNYARTQDLAWVTLFSTLAGWTLLRFLDEGRVRNLAACVLCILGATVSKGPGLFHALMPVCTIGIALAQPRHWASCRKNYLPLAAAALVGCYAIWASGFYLIFYGGILKWSEPRFIGHAYTIGRVFWEFAWRSVVPVSLSADHHIAETMIPAGASFWNIPDTGAMWAAAGMFALTAFSLFLTWRKSTRLVGICLFLYVATMLLRVFYLIPEFMPEYRIYPGLPWFCLGVAIVLHAGLRKLTTIPPRIPAVALVAVFIFLSAKRSFVWHSLESLLGDVLKQYPTQARAVWELDDWDVNAKNWQAVIDRQQQVWPEVARRFHAQNRLLAPGRELPTGHFALAEVACAGHYAHAIAATQSPAAGMREIAKLEIYMRRLGLDPVAHQLHWGYFFINKALILEMAGKDEAALEILENDGKPLPAKEAIDRLKAKVAAKPASAP